MFIVGFLGRRSLLPLAGALALAVGGVSAALAAPTHGLPGGLREAFGGASRPPAGTCVLPVRAFAPGRPAAADRAAAGSTDQAGNLVVAVPRAVFIRPRGQWLWITTNTGARPAADDQFWLIDDGHASPASAALRRYAETCCANTGRRPRQR
ncbi:MAG TPA: hypothetical protein VME70_03370 [Mycobacteriales bacterium]|nr:hypothetical protein [Mycobacteriales bacterium]